LVCPMALRKCAVLIEQSAQPIPFDQSRNPLKSSLYRSSCTTRSRRISREVKALHAPTLRRWSTCICNSAFSHFCTTPA
jgi:hypothetical protein